jgi:GNAT superfamily N-acetyltransferase
MKSNYGLYLEELEGIEILESNRGFATYNTKGDELWIYDVFVRPDYRGCGIAKRYFDELEEIAKERNCKYMVTLTNKNNNGWEKSTKMLTDHGYEVFKTLEDGTIFLKLEI